MRSPAPARARRDGAKDLVSDDAGALKGGVADSGPRSQRQLSARARHVSREASPHAQQAAPRAQDRDRRSARAGAPVAPVASVASVAKSSGVGSMKQLLTTFHCVSSCPSPMMMRCRWLSSGVPTCIRSPLNAYCWS